MMFAYQFDNNLFALPLFEGICHSNSKKESTDETGYKKVLGTHFLTFLYPVFTISG
jgi:hypothetical protein